MPYSLLVNAQEIDFGSRFYTSSAIVGSPAAATETIVCQITGIDGFLAVAKGIFLSGVVSFTVGTSGTAIRVRIRQGTTAGAGTVIADTNALTGGVAAGNLLSQDLQNTDTNAAGGAVPQVTSYHLSLQVTGGAATSTVSQVNLVAFVA